MKTMIRLVLAATLLAAVSSTAFALAPTSNPPVILTR